MYNKDEMINPQPVYNPNSPYSNGNQSGNYQIPPPTPKTPNEPKNKIKIGRIIGFIVLFLIVGTASFAYAQYKYLKNKVIVNHEGQTSNILGVIKPETLNSDLFKQPGDGRFNLVVVGVGGANHPGGNLTDSIQVISIDTLNKKMTTTSIPRDLYVNIPGFGHSKINEAYSDGEIRKTGGGGLMVREVVGNVLGINISNFIRIDFTGAKDLVDALGGIEVNVPTAIYDPYYPDERTVGYQPFSIKAGLQKMDGTTALKYSRSRETTSDFDRSKRQQIVITAIKKKALSAGVLTNPSKIISMLNALGTHVKTDLQTSEIKSLASIYKDIPDTESKGYVLDTSASLGLLTASTTQATGYIAYPVKGYDKYESIQQWFQKNSPDPLIVRDNPTITVVNGGTATKQQLIDQVVRLTDYGFKARIVDGDYYNVNSTSSTTAINGNFTKVIKNTSNKLFVKNKNIKKPFANNYFVWLYGGATVVGDPANSDSDFTLVYVPGSTLNSIKTTTTPTSSAKTSPKTSISPSVKASISPVKTSNNN